jgi:hypothetical protein
MSNSPQEHSSLLKAKRQAPHKPTTLWQKLLRTCTVILILRSLTGCSNDSNPESKNKDLKPSKAYPVLAFDYAPPTTTFTRNEVRCTIQIFNESPILTPPISELLSPEDATYKMRQVVIQVISPSSSGSITNFQLEGRFGRWPGTLTGAEVTNNHTIQKTIEFSVNCESLPPAESYAKTLVFDRSNFQGGTVTFIINGGPQEGLMGAVTYQPDQTAPPSESVEIANAQEGQNVTFTITVPR